MEFKDLYDKFPKESDRIAAMEDTAEICRLFIDIKDAEAVKRMEKTCLVNVNLINGKLLSDRDMTKEARDILLAQRDIWEYFLTIFPNKEKTLNQLEQFIKEKTYGTTPKN